MDDEFAGALAACATIDAVKALFKQRIAVHGYTASACGAFLPTDMGPETHFFFQDWPPDWIELYVRVRPGTHDARAMRRIRTMAAAA